MQGVGHAFSVTSLEYLFCANEATLPPPPPQAVDQGLVSRGLGFCFSDQGAHFIMGSGLPHGASYADVYECCTAGGKTAPYISHNTYM